MRNLKFHYQLSQEEMKEVLLCADWKKGGLFHNMHVWIMSILGIFVLYEYSRSPQNFFLFFMLAGMILLLIHVIYSPSAKRKKALRRMMETGGEYQVEIHPDRILFGEENKEILLGERKINAVYTEHIYTIQAGRELFALPRRIISKEQKEHIEKILKQNHSQTIRLVVEKEGTRGKRW